jgi:hypothetical protein
MKTPSTFGQYRNAVTRAVESQWSVSAQQGSFMLLCGDRRNEESGMGMLRDRNRRLTPIRSIWRLCKLRVWELGFDGVRLPPYPGADPLEEEKKTLAKMGAPSGSKQSCPANSRTLICI